MDIIFYKNLINSKLQKNIIIQIFFNFKGKFVKLHLSPLK